MRVQSCPVLVLSLLSAAAGCDQVWGFDRSDAGPPPGPCGDGVLLPEEDCDDGNQRPGDGCDASCAIEPGFECPSTVGGVPCLPVVGLSRGPVTTTLPAAGQDSGIAFTFECPATDVVIGFEWFTNDLNDNLGQMTIVCGSLALGADAVAVVTRTSTSGTLGTEPRAPRIVAVCNPDEVATGFIPNINRYVSGFQWICQRLTHASGTLQLGATRTLTVGPSAGTVEATQSCPPGMAVTQVHGKSGNSIDNMGLGCSPLTTVLCGDGKVQLPETCDDGNLTRRDGCDGRCQLE